MNRRNFLRTSASIAPLAALAACGVKNTPPLTPAQIVTQVGAIATGLSGAVAQIAVAYPALIPPTVMATITSDLAMAKVAADTLAPNLPAASGASLVRQVEGYVNAVLNLLAAPPVNGLIPAPFNEAFAAASILVPQLEAYVSIYIPAAAASLKTAATLAQFRAAAPVSEGNAVAVLQSFK